MRGYVHSLQSLGTVDGPGVRAVVFLEGCPLRCVYCHNPDTWEFKECDLCDSDELAERILRLYPYIKDGGVTFSGGEPLLQAEFVKCVAERLKKRGLHIAIDTSGMIYNGSVSSLLDICDLVLLDIKMTDAEGYKKYTGGSLSDAVNFLKILDEKGIDTWIRHVVVPGINDTEDGILELKKIASPFKCVKKIELLPFKKLCIEKYKSLGIEFALSDTPELSSERLNELNKLI